MVPKVFEPLKFGCDMVLADISFRDIEVDCTYVSILLVKGKKMILLSWFVGGMCNVRALASRSNNNDFPALSKPIIRILASDVQPRKK